MLIDQVSQLSLTNNRISSDKSYLCTDCDVLLRFEPCLMCAMALLHSRVKRVFYYEEEEKDSGSGCSIQCKNDKPFSKIGLHEIQSLNHHFTVHKIVVNKDNRL